LSTEEKIFARSAKVPKSTLKKRFSKVKSYFFDPNKKSGLQTF